MPPNILYDFFSVICNLLQYSSKFFLKKLVSNIFESHLLFWWWFKMCGVISVAWSIPVPLEVSCTQLWRSANLQYRKPTKKMWKLPLYTYPAWRLTVAETTVNNSLQFFLENLGRSIRFLWSVWRLLGASFCFLDHKRSFCFLDHKPSITNDKELNSLKGRIFTVTILSAEINTLRGFGDLHRVR